MEPVIHVQDDSRRLMAGWLILALVALALSTLCAVLLVAARAPLPGGFAGTAELFGRALVLHVTFAVVVWFLACAAGIWTLAAGGRGGETSGTVRWIAIALSALGLAGMLAPLFSGAAQPVLANYVPVLDHPLFLAGLMLLAAGVGLHGAATARDVMRGVRDGQVWQLGALLSMIAAAFALGALIASIALAGLPSTPAGFETVAWAPGHLLQFVHVLLLMSVWIMLGESALGESLAPRRWLTVLLLTAAAPLLAVPAIYLGYPIDGADFRRAFTRLMTWGLWPAPALLGLLVLSRLMRAWRKAKLAPATPALVLSVVLFLIGCVLGALIRTDSTMVPAHYHGTVGAVTLAYMALGYHLLPAFGVRARGMPVRWQPVLYGAGLIVLALALAWSGWLGVPRKTLHMDVIVQHPAYFAAMGLVAVGGLLAIGGAALYVVNIVRAVYTAAAARGGRRDVRLQALGMTLGATALCGLLLAYWPDEFGRSGTPYKGIGDPAAHAADQRRQEIDRKFAEGVRQLAARDYQAAASALHRVLELAPQMPEAHVNMGFAMIGLQKPEMARDFFEAALSLRTAQMNAYYGLAVALEATGDLEGALGAMRTYVHRGQPDDPFIRKANAAIWEWETALAKTRRDSSAPMTVPVPENGKGTLRYPITEKKFN
jgi:cytochrome c oxidase subunit I